MTFLINLVLFIVSLAILVVIHEFGHFITAKIFKVYVTEFSIGFGPAIFTTKKDGKETRFSIRGVPLGGYCAMVGETLPDLTEEEYLSLSEKDKEAVDLYLQVPPERRLDGIAKWKRAIIMVAGVFLNYILGFALVFTSNATARFLYITDNAVKVEENSLAYNNGLRSEDHINNASFYIYFAKSDDDPSEIEYEDDKRITYTVDCSFKEDDIENTNYLRALLMSATSYSPKTINDYIKFEFVTDSQTNPNVSFNLPSTKSDDGIYSWSKMGVTFVYKEEYKRKLSSQEVVKYSFEDTGEFTVAIYKALGSLFTKEGISQVGGVITMFDVSSQVTSMGFPYYLRFWGLISINLAVMNLLPFPGLDGWHFLVIIIESITRKELPKKFKNIMQTVGMVLLFALMIIITFKDIFMKII